MLGDILDGIVRIGMVVDAGPAFRSTIHAVEGLGFRYAGAEEFLRWQEVAWEGLTLDIRAGRAFDASPDSSPF